MTTTPNEGKREELSKKQKKRLRRELPKVLKLNRTKKEKYNYAKEMKKWVGKSEEIQKQETDFIKKMKELKSKS